MNRRLLLAIGLLLPSGKTGLAQEAPWKARFLDGGFDGTDYWAGFAVEMSEGWKTYWRVPGTGGVPPQVEVKGAQLKSAEFQFPLPGRFRDQDGESIGYKKAVVFPIRLTPAAVAVPLQVELSAFFGVCEIVCIPARSEGKISFAASSITTPDTVLLATWREKVPQLSTTGPVQSATAVMADGKAALMLSLGSPVEEIFAVGADKYYFQAPRMEGGRAILLVSGAKSATELQGQSVRLITVSGGNGLEQELMVL